MPYSSLRHGSVEPVLDFVIVVNGVPGAGKTTLAAPLARESAVPLLATAFRQDRTRPPRAHDRAQPSHPHPPERDTSQLPARDTSPPVDEGSRSAVFYAGPVSWPVSAKAVIVRNGTVLLARNERDEWELPGGRVERGEEPAAAAVRKVGEETGLLVQIRFQLGLTPLEIEPDRFVLIAAFACTIVEERDLVVSEEHAALQWQPLAELHELALPSVYRDFVALAARGRVVLVGDSHLAKINRHQLRRLSELTAVRYPVVNHAAGGSTALDVLTDLELSALLPQDRVVVSVGTNDYAPWKRVPLQQFRSTVEELLNRLQHHRPVLLLPPPVDEQRQTSAGRTGLRMEQDRAPYVNALQAAAAAHGAPVVQVEGAEVHAADGVHMSDAGYEILIPRLADALNSPA